MLTQTRITDPRAWNDIVRSLPYSHVLQSWEWGEFKQRYGWKAERLVFEKEGVVAAAQVLARRARPLPLYLLYVPKGPLLDYRDRPLRQAVLEALVAYARKQRAIFIKIDPDVVVEDGLPGAGEATDDPLGLAFTGDLQAGGWRFSADQIQFRNTVQVDLAREEEALLAAMKQKTRYNVRLADRRGVRIRPGDSDDLEMLFWMYAETAERDDFLIRPLDYYRDAWGTFMEAGLAQALIAEHDGQAIAAVILFFFQDRVWYMYGASRNERRELMPNHLLQWEAMRWAKRQGYAVYDFWGAPNEFVEDDPMWGVWRFKAGFGGRIVRHVGAWDRTINRPWHWVYSVVVPLYLAALRSLRS